VAPHLPVAVERRERPRLAGQPVIVVDDARSSRSNAVVLDCSHEALAAGVQPGMALSRAEHLCPEAAFLPPRLDLYRAAATALFDLLSSQMPAVEQAQPGGIYLDLRGLEGRDGEALAICHGQCEAIERELRLPATAGVAINKFSAEVASLSIGLGRVLVLTAGAERAFLAGFPVTVLPVGDDMQRRLHLFGLRWLEQFARLPPAAVLAQFGWEGQRAHLLARGEDNRPLVPGHGERSEQTSRQFDPPLDNLETLLAAAGRLVESLAQRLASAWLRAGRLALEAQCADGASLAAERTLAEATADAGRLARLAETLLRPLPYSDRIEALAVTLSDLSAPSLHQLSLWHNPQEQAAEAHLRRLAARYGPDCFQRSALIAPEHRLAGRRYVMVNWVTG
jgi:nucleotidyltransferase/DNA polymerase involved in DNA repair